MSFTIRKPDDFHVHFRQGSLMPLFVRDTAAHFARALVMPNTLPAITTPAEVIRYGTEILEAAPGFIPLMSFAIQPWMNRTVIRDLKSAKAVAGKLYPKGATTNSENGVTEIEDLFPVFEEMQKLGLVLSIHGEDPEAPVLLREQAYLPVVEHITRSFPLLKVVLEHISTREALRFVLSGPATLAATVTAHHLLLTIDDLLGGKLDPHVFCKPVVKSAEDREALREAVVSGTPKLFFGSDSAPHPRADKERAGAAAGIYSGPVALPLLAELFEQYEALHRLENFTSRFGAEFYGLPLLPGTITLEKEFQVIPETFHDIVPLHAGRNCSYRVIPGLA